MTWEGLKHIIGEMEEVLLKGAAAIYLLLFAVEILMRKASELISKWKGEGKTSKRR